MGLTNCTIERLYRPNPERAARALMILLLQGTNETDNRGTEFGRPVREMSALEMSSAEHHSDI